AIVEMPQENSLVLRRCRLLPERAMPGCALARGIGKSRELPVFLAVRNPERYRYEAISPLPQYSGKGADLFDHGARSRRRPGFRSRQSPEQFGNRLSECHWEGTLLAVANERFRVDAEQVIDGRGDVVLRHLVADRVRRFFIRRAEDLSAGHAPS